MHRRCDVSCLWEAAFFPRRDSPAVVEGAAAGKKCWVGKGWSDGALQRGATKEGR